MATADHARYIGENMRAADRQEVWASSHALPDAATMESFRRSLECWTGVVDGEPICIFGVAPVSLVTGYAAPWMLGTDQLERNAVKFLRGSKEVVAGWKRDYRHLFNYVDARNKTSIRWLKWLGFELEEPAPYGAEKLPFHRFEYLRK